MNKITGIILLVLLFLMAPFAKNYAVGQEMNVTPDLVQRGNVLIIRKDFGGPLSNYMMRYSRMREHAASIAIDGECDSACTLFLGYIPQQNICITTNAKMGFHRSNRPEGTTVMLMNYPQNILMWVLAEGLTEDIKFLPEEIMKSMFARCPDGLINPPETEKID